MCIKQMYKAEKLQKRMEHKLGIDQNKKILVRILCVALFSVAVDIYGHVRCRSFSLLSDGLHLLGDSIGIAVNLVALHVQSKKTNGVYNYGYYRIEILASLFSLVCLWIPTAYLVKRAYQTYMSSYQIGRKTFLLVATLNLFLNTLCIYMIHSSQTGCAHHKREEEKKELYLKTEKKAVWTDRLLRKLRFEKFNIHNLNVKATYVHIVCDVFQSVATIAISAIIYIRPTWVLADFVCTVLFCTLVVFSSTRLGKEILNIILQKTPSDIDLKAIVCEMLEMPTISGVEDVHVWRLTNGRDIMSAVIVPTTIGDHAEAVRDAKNIAHKSHILHTTFEIATWKDQHTCALDIPDAGHRHGEH